MNLVQLATRIDERTKRAVEEVCRDRGLKMNRFVEEALLDKLEELADIEDIKSIRFESTRPLSELVEDLGLNDEL